MEQKWLPAEHGLMFQVELNPREAVVRTRGEVYGVYRVDLAYRRVADEVNEWEESVVILRTSGGPLYKEALDEIPPWLAEIEARAQPANP